MIKNINNYPVARNFRLSIRNVAYIGLRSVDRYERLVIEKFGITAFGIEDVERYGKFVPTTTNKNLYTRFKGHVWLKKSKILKNKMLSRRAPILEFGSFQIKKKSFIFPKYR